MEITLVKSQQSRDMLHVDGFTYGLERETNGRFRWRCVKRSYYKCKARVVSTLKDGKHKIVFQSTIAHTHERSEGAIDVYTANQRVRALATTSLLPKKIVNEAIQKCKPFSRDFLPTKKAQKAKILRVRQSIVKEPTTLDDIYIPRYLERELYVQSEKKFGADGLIVLMARQSGLNLLKDSDVWLMDGTLQVVPALMRHLFILHGRVSGHIVPLVFCLMTHQSKLAYTTVFEELVKVSREQYQICYSPTTIFTDFQDTIKMTAKNIFPDARYKGSFFHLSQIIDKKVTDSGYRTLYESNEIFSQEIDSFKCLAFVPHEEMRRHYRRLKGTLLYPETKTIGKWLKNNYLGTATTAAPHPPDFWYIDDALEENFPSIQASIESWRNRLNDVIGNVHAGLLELIKNLGYELMEAENISKNVQRVDEITARQSTYKKMQRIQIYIQEKKGKLSEVEYLERLAHILASAT